MFEDYKKCNNSLCLRKVKQSVMYCCHPCGLAQERGYEIHETGPLGHTTTCNARNEERKPIDPADAPYYSAHDFK